MLLQMQHFPLSYLKTRSVRPAGIQTCPKQTDALPTELVAVTGFTDYYNQKIIFQSKVKTLVLGI